MTLIVPLTEVYIMTVKAALHALSEFFSATVAAMPNMTFNSHEFLRTLSKDHQREYIEALYTYRDNQYPFKDLHGDLMSRLAASGSVEYTRNRESSKDTFGIPQQVPVWKKR